MLIPSHLQLEPTNSRTRVPAGGIDLIASIDFKSDGATTAALSSSTKVSQGDDAISSAEAATPNHSNQQYSIYAITDAAANIVERYAYTAYGQPTILNAAATVIATSAISNRYTYTAREWDATVGLYHFRARWMSGVTGRFLSRDPIGYLGGYTMYGFLNSRVLVNVDPTGLICKPRLLNPNQPNGTYRVEGGRTKEGWISDFFSEINYVASNRFVGFADNSSASFEANGTLVVDEYLLGIWLIDRNQVNAEATADCTVRCSKESSTGECRMAIECSGAPITGIYAAFDQQAIGAGLSAGKALAGISWDIWLNGHVGGVNAMLQGGAAFEEPQIEVNANVGGSLGGVGGTIIIPPRTKSYPSPFTLPANPQWECYCDGKKE